VPTSTVAVESLHAAVLGADLGFYKGGSPIGLKGAPEVERRRRRGGWGLLFGHG